VSQEPLRCSWIQ